MGGGVLDQSVPDVAGRDLCGGGALPREARRREPDPVAGLIEYTAAYLSTATTDDRNLSERALELVNGPRQDAYAPPEQNMARIGSAWAAMLGLPEPIPGWRVALMLAGMKVIRASHKPGDDSLIDSVGYLEIARRLRP